MNYNFDPQANRRFSRDVERTEESEVINLDEIMAAARRQWKIVAASTAIFMALGVGYILTAVPKYQSSASILIDAGNQKIADQVAELSGVLVDESSVLSQVELLRSENIAQAVADGQNLRHNPAFMNQGSGIDQAIGFIRDLVTGKVLADGEQAVDEGSIRQKVIETLGRNMEVERVGRSYVLSLTYTSTDPVLSAQIAKAFTDAYLAEQLDAKYNSTRRAGDWLQDRLATLREKARESDAKVQKFKQEKNLISTGGQLVSEQQLTQISNQLIGAQNDTLSARAKVEEIEAIIQKGDMDAAVSESIASPVVNKLRDQFLEASREEADISSRLGKNHAQAVKKRREMGEFRRLMFEELARIAQSYKSTLAIAQARENNLTKQVETATNTSAIANDDQVRLRELQRESDTYRNLYRTFLQRWQETVQQESFPVTEARVISNPVPALKPSSPKKGIALALSALLGMMVGGGLGVAREWRDRFFRTGDQVRSQLDLEFIGNVPMTESRAIVMPRNGKGDAVDDRRVFARNSIYNYSIDNPLSSFAETLRSAKIAIDLTLDRKRPKIIGVVSVYPGEGKSTIAINFSQLLAKQGAKVLLMDADLRNPGATRAIGRNAEKGIFEALTNNVPVSDLIIKDDATGLDFLPAVVTQRVPFSSDLLASAAMDHIFSDASSDYDYIVIDLPPLGLLVDARAMSTKVDSYLMVVEWGKTPRAIVKKILQSNWRIFDKCVGVILNNVDNSKLSLYDGFGTGGYYSKHYFRYFEDKH